MLIACYEHRLPADHDLSAIRRRVEVRAPEWDAVPELHFKAFLLRERGQYGARANSYSSLYLWRKPEPFRDFLVADGKGTANSFEIVTGSFGRPAIQTWLSLDARQGPETRANFASLRETDIGTDVDLPSFFARESERNRRLAAQPGTVAAVLGLDVRAWRLVEIRLTRDPPEEGAEVYQVAHLSRPLLDTLPQGGSS